MKNPDQNTEELELVIVRVVRELWENDPVAEWARGQMELEKKREERRETIKTSALGHLVWITLVVTGTAVWEYVKRRVGQ